MFSSSDKSHELVAVASVFGGLAIISVGVRVYTRAVIIKCIGADDILILFGEFFAVIQVVVVITASTYGLGRHMDTIPLQEGKAIRILLWLAMLSYHCSATLVKVSLLAFYLRLSSCRKFRNLVIVLMVFSGTAGLAGIFVSLFQCSPLAGIWDVKTGHCIQLTTFYVANAAIHIFSEILIYIVPIRGLWNLHLPTRQRIALCSLMGIGMMLIVISIYRIVSIGDIASSPDFFWETITPIILYTVELQLAVFISCGPAHLAFCRCYFPRIFGGPPIPKKHQRAQQIAVTRRPTIVDEELQKTETQEPSYKGVVTSRLRETIELTPDPENSIRKQVDVWIKNEDINDGLSRSTKVASTEKGGEDEAQTRVDFP